MYRKLLLATAAAAAFAAPALAADLTRQPPPPPYIPPPPVFTWTGVYIGGQVGGAWGAGNNLFTGFTPGGAFIDSNIGGNPSGVIGGAHLGYQVQINQWILGIEGSVDGSSLSKTVTVGFPDGTSLTANTSADVQGSIRGKLGIAWDRFMIYGTGGVAFGGFNTDLSVAGTGLAGVPFFSTLSVSNTRVGWTAGGGIQYAVTPNWWVFAEYRFSDFGTLNNGAFPGLAAGAFFNDSHRIQENQVQAGFSYKFDILPPPPVVAKY